MNADWRRQRGREEGAMLVATFLGHQGWQFVTPQTRILVDPLLVEAFGHAGATGRVDPPRLLDVAKIEPVDAVFLTHEHEDHFNVPSFHRIARDVPVYVPARSSSALRRFLAHLGFAVFPVTAGESVEIGDLVFQSFTADHVRRDELDEWDVLPFAVVDLEEGASFFSCVDVSPPIAMEAAWSSLSGGQGIWSITNNAMNLGVLDSPEGAAPDPLLMASRLYDDFARQFSQVDRPLATVFCGSGFSLIGPTASMNNVLFPLDMAGLAATFSRRSPNDLFLALDPGAELSVVEGRLSHRDHAPFLSTALSRPDKRYVVPMTTAPVLADLGAACGEVGIDKHELQELHDLLKTFARQLYGSALFRALYSLGPQDGEGVTQKLAIRALCGSSAVVFEYDPTTCAFLCLDADRSAASYIIALECYAADLLRVLQCRLSLSAMMFGRVRRYYVHKPDLRWALDRALWQFAHPLRHPDRFLEFYMALSSLEPADVPMVQGRRAGP